MTNELRGIAHVSTTFFEAGDDGLMVDYGLNTAFQVHKNALIYGG